MRILTSSVGVISGYFGLLCVSTTCALCQLQRQAGRRRRDGRAASGDGFRCGMRRQPDQVAWRGASQPVWLQSCTGREMPGRRACRNGDRTGRKAATRIGRSGTHTLAAGSALIKPDPAGRARRNWQASPDEPQAGCSVRIGHLLPIPIHAVPDEIDGSNS